MRLAGRGQILYAKNIDDALNNPVGPHQDASAALNPDARLNEELELIWGANPDVIFLSEAWDAGRSQERVASVAEDFVRRGYAVRYEPYSEGQRKDEHGFFVAVRSEKLVGNIELVHFAGRGGVRAVIEDENSDKHITALGAHFNDLRVAREREIADLIENYVDSSEAQVLVDDFNNSIDYRPLALALKAGGLAFQLAVKLGLCHEAAPGEIDPKTLDRLASLAIRARAQVNGKQIRALRRAGFFDADPKKQSTTLVPSLPAGVVAKLSKSKHAKSWLDKPHLRSDHLMANQGRFEDFQLYPHLTSAHCGISARYILSKRV